jgi:Na+/H+ antiporter NhaD/arsenite permease-like protein
MTGRGPGFLSAVFDNIPLTALALKQGGIEWGYLAFAVGFGGSIIWFGSSAGVAESSLFPEAKSTVNWIGRSSYVPLSYVLGFAIMLLALGWHPDASH